MGILEQLLSSVGILRQPQQPNQGVLAQFLQNGGGAAVGNPNLMAQGDRAKEAQFMAGIQATPWYKSFLQRYGEAPNLGPDADYDYRKAWAAGIRPQPDPYDNNFPHWPSSTGAGEMLKAPNHPTAWKEYYMRQTGINPDAVGATEDDWNRMQRK